MQQNVLNVVVSLELLIPFKSKCMSKTLFEGTERIFDILYPNPNGKVNSFLFLTNFERFRAARKLASA